MRSGVNSTASTSTIERSAAWFNFLFVNIPILNSECSERILYAWITCDNANTANAIVWPPATVPVDFSPIINANNASNPNITPWRTILTPNPWANKPSFLGFGFCVITSDSTASIPSAMAGKLSVTRLIHKSCIERSGVLCHSIIAVKTVITSPIFVPSR